MASNRHVTRERLDQLTGDVTGEATDVLLQSGCTNGIRPDTVRRDLPRLVAAAADLQQAGVEPTDRALYAAGAPEPRKTQRLIESTNLEDFAATQSLAAIEAGMVEVPERLVVEAFTDRTRGPAKAGGVHLQPPPCVEVPGAGKGAKNTPGGIAAAVTVGESNGTLMPFGTVPLFQEFWHPAHPAYRNDPGSAEAALRAFGGIEGPFTSTPPEIARELIARLGSVEAMRKWAVGLGRPFLCGGRMRLGFPANDGDPGSGTQEDFLGADLDAIRAVDEAGYIPFFELPHGLRGPAAAAPSAWRFRTGGETLTLDELVALVLDPDSAWTTVARDRMAEMAPPGTVARWVRARVTAPASWALDLTVLAVVRSRGQLDLFVTTHEIATEDDLAAVVNQGVEELRRRQRSSVMATGVRELLDDGHLQTTQRRRARERTGYGAVVQAAWGVLELGRRAA